MEDKYRKSGKELPQNRDLAYDAHKDKIMRHLDCAAIEFMHAEIFDQVQRDIRTKGYSDYKIFDTARGVFTEGGPAFQGAGLFAKCHIQICVRNPNCIQGFYLVTNDAHFNEAAKIPIPKVNIISAGTFLEIARGTLEIE